MELIAEGLLMGLMHDEDFTQEQNTKRKCKQVVFLIRKEENKPLAQS
jgi:hypothetical protein